MSAIEEIKSRLDIVEFVGGYVPLKKAGRNYRALCPFHQEKTPSFIVFPESQHYHCFGCGASGDVFTFAMQMENLDFSEALSLLARRAGVVLRPPTPQEAEADRERKRLQELNLAAAHFFHHQLRYGEAGATARAYLKQREVADEMVEAFLLGYAPERWDALSSHLRERGYREEELLSAGLVIEREGGGSYDRFRGRLIFPIRDLQGHVTGFGGRTLDPEGLPKYLNSPQTPLFDKGSVLYGLDQAAPAIRREGRAVLVEGYFDVIIAHQHGYKNVVCPMGTALTAAQVHLLKRLTQRLLLALDADAAGSMAMLRGLEVIKEAMDQRTVLVPTAQGVLRAERELDGEVRIVVLPAGRDPDEVIRADRTEWEKRLEQALPVLEYVLGQIAQEADLTTARGKSEAVQQALPLLAEVHDPVQRAHYVQRLAHLAQVDERTIAAQLRTPVPSRRRRGARETPVGVAGAPEVPLLIRREEVVEGYLLALLHRFPQLWEQLPPGIEALLSQEEHRALLRVLSEVGSVQPADLGELGDYLEGLLARFPAESELDEGLALDALHMCLSRLEALANERQRREFRDVLAQAQEEGNRELAEEIIGRLSSLSQRRWGISMPPPRRVFPDLRRFLGDDGQDHASDTG